MSSKHKALNARHWARARRACFERDFWRCQKCSKPGALECHHVVSLERGGAAYALANLQTICRGCHIELHCSERDSRRPDFVKRWRELVRRMV